MPEPIKIEEVKERVILVGVSEQDGDDAEDSVAELAELVKTAGAVTVGTLIQKRELIHPGTYVGTGKVQEIADMIAELGATGIVCDDELSPAQKLRTDVRYKSHGPDAYYPRYFCGEGNNKRGKDPGRAGAVEIQAEPSDRTWQVNVKTRRRYRNQRTR